MSTILGRLWRFARIIIVAGIAVAVVRLFRERAPGRPAGEGALPPWRGPAWLRHFVTQRFDPLVTHLGLVGGRRSPWAFVEHVGRTSGTVRRTPILPRVVGDHVLIPLPYGRAAHWVRNIQASGHCRMQLHEHVYELDEPQVLVPEAVTELPAWQRGSALQGSFEFLRLRIFREQPGTLDSVSASGLEEAIQGEAAKVEKPSRAGGSSRRRTTTESTSS